MKSFQHDTTTTDWRKCTCYLNSQRYLLKKWIVIILFRWRFSTRTVRLWTRPTTWGRSSRHSRCKTRPERRQKRLKDSESKDSKWDSLSFSLSLSFHLCLSLSFFLYSFSFFHTNCPLPVAPSFSDFLTNYLLRSAISLFLCFHLSLVPLFSHLNLFCLH